MRGVGSSLTAQHTYSGVVAEANDDLGDAGDEGLRPELEQLVPLKHVLQVVVH